MQQPAFIIVKKNKQPRCLLNKYIKCYTYNRTLFGRRKECLTEACYNVAETWPQYYVKNTPRNGLFIYMHRMEKSIARRQIDVFKELGDNNETVN